MGRFAARSVQSAAYGRARAAGSASVVTPRSQHRRCADRDARKRQSDGKRSAAVREIEQEVRESDTARVEPVARVGEGWRRAGDRSERDRP